MRDIVVVGAGKIGATIADMLGATGDYRVVVADRSELQLAGIRKSAAVSTQVVDIADKAALESLVATYAAEIMNITKVRAISFDPRATATAMRARAFPGADATTLKTPPDVAATLVKLLQDDFETAARVAY